MIILRKIWYFAVWILVKIGLYFFYKKVTVTGRSNIPKNAPVIFAGNHENAFIDAFLIATHNTKLCNFLVRADVFRFKPVRMFFSTLNMQPVYRIRDGFSSLKSNEVIFESCYSAFGNGESLIMFPEGTHDMRRIKRKLTKGISRLALGAMNSNSGPEKLYVVPVGIDYSAHEKFRSEVQINFGEPILVEKQPMEPKYFDALRTEIQEGLGATHIALEEKNYDLLNNLVFDIENRLYISNYKQINQEAKKLHTHLQEAGENEELVNHSEIFSNTVSLLNSSYTDSRSLFMMILLSILSFPIFVYGILMNSIVLAVIYITDRFIITDRTFIGSINFSLGFVLFPILWYNLYEYSADFLETEAYTIFFLISLPLSLIAFQGISNFYSNMVAKFKLMTQSDLSNKFSQSKEYLKAYKTTCLDG